MPFLVCGSEGEWALYENVLSPLGADTKRRGSVHLTNGQTMFASFAESDDLWIHVRLAAGDWGTGALGSAVLQDIIQIKDNLGQTRRRYFVITGGRKDRSGNNCGSSSRRRSRSRRSPTRRPW